MPADTHAEQLPGWEAMATLNGLETAFWRLDTHEALRSHAVLVWILEHAPRWDRLLACFDDVTRVLPRLRTRVVDAPWQWGWAAWQEDPAFDVHHHLERIRLPSPGGRRELLDLAERVGASPFDPARPPWRIVLVEELEEDRAALVIKIHHCITDGGGLREAMLAVLPSSRRSPKRSSGASVLPLQRPRTAPDDTPGCRKPVPNCTVRVRCRVALSPPGPMPHPHSGVRHCTRHASPGPSIRR
ncbi:wax ester/triacylglycerol synthase domain-containing protein [Streptomyces tauricus]|uniref:wax ester/triacylglycerol synthase domain-containing protein n=1 Tax=Streptomyces tauricus TaxID=68274 RepID=UPI0016728F48